MNIGSMLETCDQCERVCCQECTTTLFCDYCDIYHCADCKDVVECSRSDCNIKFVPTAWRWRSVTNAKNAGVVIALQCSLDALFVPKDYAVIVPEKKV